jgi:hypothetical protein
MKNRSFITVRKSGVEVNTNNTKYTFISREQYARQNYDTQRSNKFIASFEHFMY